MGNFHTIAEGADAGLRAALAVPMMLESLGFTSSGIAPGSIAASMMSDAAAANGGQVAAGSLVATLQSAGAAGLSSNVKAAVAMIGGSIGACVEWLGSFFQGKKRKKSNDENIAFGIFAVSLVAAIYLQHREVKGRRRK